MSSDPTPTPPTPPTQTTVRCPARGAVPSRPPSSLPPWVGALAVAGLAAGCGGGPSFADGGADAVAPAVDGSATGDDAPADAPADAPLDAGPADGASAAGSCVLTLSNEVGGTTVNTTIAFPYMSAVNMGMVCNSATPPTLCHVGATDGSLPTAWTIYLEPSTLADGTALPILPGIATMPDAAIGVYLEGNNRWDAASGTLTIDHQAGNLVSFHAVAQMAPDATSPGSATGTFQLDAVCVDVDFRP